MAKKNQPDLIEDLDEQLPEQDEKPDPQPGDPDYDWEQHYPDGVKLYRHVYPDGQVVALRRFNDITSKQWLISLGDYVTDFQVETASVARAACPEAEEIIRNRPAPLDGPDDFQDLWDSWTKAGNDGEQASAGE